MPVESKASDVRNNAQVQKKMRKIGLELEFTGPELKDVTRLAQKHFQGEIVVESAYIIHLKNSIWGDFRLECDSSFLKNRTYADWLSSIGIELSDFERDKWDETIAKHSDILVPKELVTPPIPRNELSKFYIFIDEFRDLYENTKGFDLSLAPLGLHINIEVASLETPYLLSVLQSFCMNYKKLVHEIGVDFKRSVAPYIAPFPEAYVKHICRNDYTPDMETFIKDYFRYNPTRNRALDMTTIFAHINWSLLENVEGLELHLINARPAFHYRLPNCHLHNPQWSVAKEIQRWDEIEDSRKNWYSKIENNQRTSNKETFTP